MWHERFRDAANPADIPLGWAGGVAGYINGGDPFHPWDAGNWLEFRGLRKLPIFVRSDPVGRSEAETDAFQALRGLYDLGVPRGRYVALDSETAQDPAYVTRWLTVIGHFGYLGIDYGSASTVFKNDSPRYWVADYRGTGPFMYDQPGVHIIMTQYASPSTGSGGQWDSSTCEPWQYFESGRWWI